MSRDWKPGDVAMVTVGGRSGIGVRGNASWSVAVGGHTNTVGDDLCSSARPLVVIDPEDPEQVERLRVIYNEQTRDHSVGFNPLQAALREFANPTPPKPREPTGLGAVVEDDKGRLFVRFRPDGGPAKWALATTDELVAVAHLWSEISAVRVFSEGVQP